MDNKKKHLFDVLWVVAGCGLIAYILLTAGYIQSLDGDNIPQTYSFFVYAIRALKNGELPLWNPTVWGGFSSSGNPITESLYPINWLLCWIFYDRDTGLVSYMMITANQILHLCVYFVGVYCLSLRLHLRRAAACAASIVSLFSMGSLIGITTWVVFLDSVCLMPLAFYFAIGIIQAQKEKRRSYKNGFGLGIVMGFMAMISVSAGQAMCVVFLAILCLFVIAEMCCRKDFSCIPQYLRSAGMAALMTVLLAAPTILATLTFLPQMSRYVPGQDFLYAWEDTGLSYTAFSELASPITQLSQFFYGGFSDGRPSMMLLGIVLIVYGAASAGKKSAVKNFFLFMAAASFLYTFGILFPAIAYWVPGANALREPFLYTVFFSFFGGIVAGYGADSIIDTFENKKPVPNKNGITGILFVIYVSNLCCPDIPFWPYKGIVILLMGSTVLINFPQLRTRIGRIIPSGKKLGMSTWGRCVAIGLVIVIAALEVRSFYDKFDGRIFTANEAASRLEEYTLLAKEQIDPLYEEDPTVRMYQVSDCYSSNLGSVLAYNDLYGYLNPSYGKQTKFQQFTSFGIKCVLQNVKYIFINPAESEVGMNPDQKVKSIQIYPTYDQDEPETIDVYATGANEGNAWFVTQAETYSDTETDEEILQKLETIDPLKTALVNEDSSDKLDLAFSAEETFSGQVEMTSYKNNAVSYQVNTTGRALLVTADSYYTGWKAYIDGQPADILEVDYLNRGVIVEEGEHVVEFRFEPYEKTVGIPCQIAGIVLCLILGAGLFLRKKDRKSSADNGIPKNEERVRYQ